MTHASAIQHVRDTLKGQEITAGIVGRPVPAFTVVSREALATLVDGDWMVRPLGVVESEEKRERAETAAESQHHRSAVTDESKAVIDGESSLSSPDQGTDARSVTSENGSVGHISPSTATDPAPIPCAECGVPLEQHEIDRIPDAKGTKFEQLCNDCCYVALGLR